MSWPGCEIREMPDGGREFHVTEAVLSYIRVDYQATLHFGEAALVIETSFSLHTGDDVRTLDPNDRADLGPLLGVYPDTLTRLSMTPDGTLTASFESGRYLLVSPHPQFEAWNIGGFWCRPGGFS